MKSNLEELSEIVARANDLFYSKFNKIDTLMGIMDKNLRKQGIQADAITIDCVALDKKIVILLHDNKPDVVNITLGNKEGCIYSSEEYKLTEISETVILGIMEKNFI
ncbi:hypothetical protein L3081_01525 [Colwellia sp. MSW7]|uniref:Uncharacterized protein n=1 Tax=Colwellia maritima TaxID=2912588 RepID=A0ABS9WWH6_9GAMM|nr:hypothetical protein [Colwellia maritima]MCI2282314.1 hypothetical protein [Colwellia maritima]